MWLRVRTVFLLLFVCLCFCCLLLLLGVVCLFVFPYEFESDWLWPLKKTFGSSSYMWNQKIMRRAHISRSRLLLTRCDAVIIRDVKITSLNVQLLLPLDFHAKTATDSAKIRSAATLLAEWPILFIVSVKSSDPDPDVAVSKLLWPRPECCFASSAVLNSAKTHASTLNTLNKWIFKTTL